mmetsp:Transcript_44244/g.73158  ORF Transcript_44244/g.73158 Transcript_44244/m.73158 type:complete len:206 (-) Transcript_44244:280-897(-)
MATLHGGQTLHFSLRRPLGLTDDIAAAAVIHFHAFAFRSIALFVIVMQGRWRLMHGQIPFLLFFLAIVTNLTTNDNRDTTQRATTNQCHNHDRQHEITKHVFAAAGRVLRLLLDHDTIVHLTIVLGRLDGGLGKRRRYRVRTVRRRRRRRQWCGDLRGRMQRAITERNCWRRRRRDGGGTARDGGMCVGGVGRQHIAQRMLTRIP